MQRYILHSLAPRSQATYRSGWSSYLQFCYLHRLAHLPPTESSLSYYVSSLADRLLTHATIKVYLSAIVYHAGLLGHSVDLESMRRLHYALIGIRRAQGGRLSRPLRDPITRQHLLALRHHLTISYLPLDALMLWAAFTAAFFGLLRSSEYTSPSASSTSSATLWRSHVSFSRDASRATLFLPISKTDQFGRGVDVRLFSLPSLLCPVSALRHYLSARSSASAPLFLFANGDFLTRDRVADVLRQVFPAQPNLNTHSFRIGGASALANAGVPDYAIQILGRWSSDSFLRYLRTPEPSIRSYQCRMLASQSSF